MDVGVVDGVDPVTTDHAVQQGFEINDPVQVIVNGFQIALRDCAELNCEIVGIERLDLLLGSGRSGNGPHNFGSRRLRSSFRFGFFDPFGAGLNERALPYSLDGEIERLTITDCGFDVFGGCRAKFIGSHNRAHVVVKSAQLKAFTLQPHGLRIQSERAELAGCRCKVKTSGSHYHLPRFCGSITLSGGGAAHTNAGLRTALVSKPSRM